MVGTRSDKNLAKKLIHVLRGFRSRWRRLLKKPVSALVIFEATVSRALVKRAFKNLYLLQWTRSETPEFFDHEIDLYWQWGSNRSSFWVERGVFSSLALKGKNVLELACGDGFNAKHFYSLRSANVVACDFDESALRIARRKNSAPNVQFVLADIRNEMPSGNFDNVIWDAAIEHFTVEEINSILMEIKTRLTQDGVLSGYTIVERSDGKKSLHHHEYEFKSKDDLLRFLSPSFRNVTVFETIYPNRHNLYFWASDETLPFMPNWGFSSTVRSSLA